MLNVEEASLLVHKKAGSYFPFRLTLAAQASYFNGQPGLDID